MGGLGPYFKNRLYLWAILEPSWVFLGPSWGHLGAIRGGQRHDYHDSRGGEAVLGHPGPSWAILGPSWCHVGAILGPSWAILG
jgi:hypothetical protein